MLQAAAQRGVRVNVIVQDEPSSSSTEQHLQSLHPNVAVLRYADNSGSWTQNEKLCLIDGRMAFLGGFDLAFGNWDTNQQALSDVHPANPAETVFPEQDYKNSRVLTRDASQGPNQLDRSCAPRMGWSDVGVCVHGQVVDDLRRHFVERWNFIYGTKYESRNDPRYSRLALYGRPVSSTSQHSQYKPPQSPQPGQQQQQSSPYQYPQYQPPLFPIGKVPGHFVPEFFQVEDFQQGQGFFLDGLFFLEVPAETAHRLQQAVTDLAVEGDFYVVQYGQFREQPDILESPGDAHLGHLIGFLPIDFLTVEGDDPFGGFIHPGEHVESRGLAGPVGTDQTDQFPLVDLHGQVGHGAQAAKDHGCVIHFEQFRHESHLPV